VAAYDLYLGMRIWTVRCPGDEAQRDGSGTLGDGHKSAVQVNGGPGQGVLYAQHRVVGAQGSGGQWAPLISHKPAKTNREGDRAMIVIALTPYRAKSSSCVHTRSVTTGAITPRDSIASVATSREARFTMRLLDAQL